MRSFYVYLTGPPTIHEDIHAARLSRQPFRTFRKRTDTERYIAARDTPPSRPFYPTILQAESELIICTDGSNTAATSAEPPRAGWGFTVSRGHSDDEYASERRPLNHADLVELNGATAGINNVRWIW